MAKASSRSSGSRSKDITDFQTTRLSPSTRLVHAAASPARARSTSGAKSTVSERTVTQSPHVDDRAKFRIAHEVWIVDASFDRLADGFPGDGGLAGQLRTDDRRREGRPAPLGPAVV